MANNIATAWKCTPFDHDMRAQFPGDEDPVYVVQYTDGTGNIIMGGKPSLVAGVKFEHEPEDFLATCTPFYRVVQVSPNDVP